MEEFLLKVFDRYGASMLLSVVLILLVWKVAPDVVKVWIDKIRAETDLIRETQNAVKTTIPNAIAALAADLKAVFVSEHRSTAKELREVIGSDTDKRIESKLADLEKAQTKIAARVGASDTEIPPPRSQQPSRPV